MRDLKKGEFRLVDAGDATNWWIDANPRKANCGWECARCWQWCKRYTFKYTVETFFDEYDVCEYCVKSLGLIW